MEVKLTHLSLILRLEPTLKHDRLVDRLPIANVLSFFPHLFLFSKRGVEGAGSRGRFSLGFYTITGRINSNDLDHVLGILRIPVLYMFTLRITSLASSAVSSILDVI